MVTYSVNFTGKKDMSAGKIQPPFLRSGDEVAIISPAYTIDEDKITDAVTILEGWGLKVHLGKNALKHDGPFAGTENERIQDIQAMTNSPDIKAVFCSRGGYGLLKIIDKIDFSALKRHPKWYIGYSDITILLVWLSERENLISVHAEMPLNYKNRETTPETLGSLHAALFGYLKPVKWSGEFFRPGSAIGEVTGGNLSLIYSLTGTPGDPETRRRILFIEDTDEYYYHLDRMLTSFNLTGKLRGLSALVSGGFTEMKDTKIPLGKSAEQIISAVTAGYNYPVFTGFPAGHLNDNRAIYIGRRAKIEMYGDEAIFSYI